jgi:Flp pilus assembly protein TadG
MFTLFRRFARARGGAVLPTFAITAIPLIVSMGAVVDYTNAWDQQTIVQDAMDSAALAAGKKIGLLSMEELQQDVNNYFTANISDQIYNPPTLNTAVEVSTITLTTELHVPTYFLGMIGIDELVLRRPLPSAPSRSSWFSTTPAR